MAPLVPLQMTLGDVCFCHWPVSPSAVADVVPGWLTVETIGGDAWITAVSYTINTVESFGLPFRGPTEVIDVRTCVRGPNGQRGVYVFASYTTDRLTAETVSKAFRLPSHHERVKSYADCGNNTRQRTLDVDGRRVLVVRYSVPDGSEQTAPPDSLAQFLTDRDRYFTSGAFGVRLSGSVGHDPWPLGTVEATATSSLLDYLDLPAAVDTPLFHYSSGVEMALGLPTLVSEL